MDYCFITLHGFVFSRISSPEEFQTFLRNEFISIQNKDLSEENAKEILLLMKKALWWNDSTYIKQLCMSVNSFFTWGPNSYIVEAINCKAWNVMVECLKQMMKAKVKFDYLHFLNLMDVEEIGLLFLAFIQQDELYHLSYLVTKCFLHSIKNNTMIKFYDLLISIWNVQHELRLFSLKLSEHLYIKVYLIPEDKRFYLSNGILRNPLYDDEMIHYINKIVANYFGTLYINENLVLPKKDIIEQDSRIIDFLI